MQWPKYYDIYKANFINNVKQFFSVLKLLLYPTQVGSAIYMFPLYPFLSVTILSTPHTLISSVITSFHFFFGLLFF